MFELPFVITILSVEAPDWVGSLQPAIGELVHSTRRLSAWVANNTSHTSLGRDARVGGSDRLATSCLQEERKKDAVRRVLLSPPHGLDVLVDRVTVKEPEEEIRDASAGAGRRLEEKPARAVPDEARDVVQQAQANQDVAVVNLWVLCGDSERREAVENRVGAASTHGVGSHALGIEEQEDPFSQGQGPKRQFSVVRIGGQMGSRESGDEIIERAGYRLRPIVFSRARSDRLDVLLDEIEKLFPRHRLQRGGGTK